MFPHLSTGSAGRNALLFSKLSKRRHKIRITVRGGAFFFSPVLILTAGFLLTQPLPLAGGLCLLAFFIIDLFVFIIRSSYASAGLSCPPLPRRCSDRLEYPGTAGEMGFRKNLDYLLSTELDWPGVERVSLEDSLVAPVRGLCFPRGSYRVKRHTLRIVSWNGFFELKIDGEASGSLTVYPGELPMEQALPGRRDQAPRNPPGFHG